MKQKYSAQQLLNAWHKDLRDSQEDRYGYSNRIDHIEYLVKMFKASGVDYNEAAYMNKKVQEILVTREGMKGKGKYKGWKENVEKDFNLILANYYVDVDTSDVIPLENTKKVPDFMFSSDPNGDMKKWLTETVGYSDLLYQETRRVGSSWWRKYLKDNFTV